MSCRRIWCASLWDQRWRAAWLHGACTSQPLNLSSVWVSQLSGCPSTFLRCQPADRAVPCATSYARTPSSLRRGRQPADTALQLAAVGFGPARRRRLPPQAAHRTATYLNLHAGLFAMTSRRTPATLLSLPELVLDHVAQLLPQGDRYVALPAEQCEPPAIHQLACVGS